MHRFKPFQPLTNAAATLAAFVGLSLAPLAHADTVEPTPSFSRCALTLASQPPLVINTEMANNPQLRALGLMNRHSLAADHGMLLIFPPNRYPNIWMRNTHIPLDLIYIDQQQRIRMIVHEATPMNDTIYPGVPTDMAVLELNAGSAKLHALKPGIAVAFSTTSSHCHFNALN